MNNEISIGMYVIYTMFCNVYQIITRRVTLSNKLILFTIHGYTFHRIMGGVCSPKMMKQ